MNIFEQASRSAVRFNSSRGQLMTEQLWKMPLTSKDGFDLDSIAKAINRDLKAETEESFVNPIQAFAKTRLELELEIAKHIIAAKLLQAEEARTRVDKADKRQKLLAILADKQDESLKGKTAEEISAMIAELG